MAESHTITGLVSRRAEVAGQFAPHKSEITRLKGALMHLDGSIKLFAPEFDLRTIPAKRTNKRNQYFTKGEAQRMTFDLLREAGIPLHSREITDRSLARKGIAPTTALVARIQKNIIEVLHRQEGRLVRQDVTGGDPGATLWVIA